MAGSRLQRQIRGARKTIVDGFVGKSVLGGDCPICFMNFEEGEKVEVLACHPTHMMHEGCFAMFCETNDKNRVRSACPQCRLPIDKTKIKRKVLKLKMDEHDDPFKIKENDAEGHLSANW